MAQKKLIVGNWKMNGSISFLKENLSHWQAQKIVHQTVICPPFPLLSIAKEQLNSPFISLGAQDCHNQPSGAFTGNTSASLLYEMGCKYVLTGHSERRQYHGETNDLVKEKAEIAIANHLIPIVCIGENLQEKEQGKTLSVLEKQIAASIPSNDSNFCVAYEPVWAIGTGKTASLEDITSAHNALRHQLGKNIKLLYGGSVTVDNYKEILSLDNVDGVLVGGASLKKNAFGHMICNESANCNK
jgi:triosephosphate isomerase